MSVSHLESLPAGPSVLSRANWKSNAGLIGLGGTLFILGNMLFALELRPVAAAGLLVGCGLGLGMICSGFHAREGSILAAGIDYPTLATCIALSATIFVLGGEGHLFYSNPDWLIRDSILADLATRGHPIVYRYAEQDYLLRAPLGMYMIPAFFGRMFGLEAAHIALLIQNSALTSITLYLVAQLAGGRKTAFLALFTVFSGADIVGVALVELYYGVHEGRLLDFTHIEWWNVYFSYQSHITQLFWAPNHALPGWWFATLMLLYARKEIDLAPLILTFAALLFWSPLAMVGVLPFLIYFGLEALPRALFTRRNLVAAGACLCFLPMAIYLTIDAGAVAHRFLVGVKGFATLYFVFLALEIPHSVVLAIAWRRIEPADRRILLLAVGILCALPFYGFGPNNDLAMRASIPSLFLLAFAFSRLATLVPRDNGPLATWISVIVLLGAATPMLEIKRAFIGSYEISDCNFLTAWRKADPESNAANYLARIQAAPEWLIVGSDARVAIEDRQCWPQHPLDAFRK